MNKSYSKIRHIQEVNSRLDKRTITEGLSQPITLEELKTEMAKTVSPKKTWDNRDVNTSVATITLMDGKLFYGDPTKGGNSREITP